jgi:hypothetical protein
MHWTIVDLPGLKRKDRASGEEADAQTNAEVAMELARSYLVNERNIVLYRARQDPWLITKTDKWIPGWLSTMWTWGG